MHKHATMPPVTVVTVNFNGKKYLKDCFDSLGSLEYPHDKLQIIMVDNGSTDGSVEFVAASYPRVSIITNDVNNYCRANNLGIKAARGRYIAFINNDVVVDAHWLGELVACIEKDPKIAAVGSKILFPDKRLQSAGHAEFPGYYWVDVGYGQKDQGQFDEEKYVASICGCAVLYRKECLDEIGQFDEDFTMYLEDVDMSLRCRAKGWKLRMCPSSVLTHVLHGTASPESARYRQELNRLLLIAKHWPDKLADQLAGKNYFSVDQGIEHTDISAVLSGVFAKILKEHGLEQFHRYIPDIVKAVRNVYSFEKDIILRDLAHEKSLLEDTQRKLSGLSGERDALTVKLTQLADTHRREREAESARWQQEVHQGKEELIRSQRESQQTQERLEQQIRSLEKSIAEIREESRKARAEIEASHRAAIDTLHADHQARIDAAARDMEQLSARKDAQIEELRARNEQDTRRYELTAAHMQAELNNIYHSTGYRYLLKPLWDFLWPVKKAIVRWGERLRFVRPSVGVWVQAVVARCDRIGARLAEMHYSITRGYSFKHIFLSHMRWRSVPIHPRKTVIMLTRKCNLSCKFCDIPSVNAEKGELSKDEAYAIIDKLRSMGVQELIVTGGEPFLHPYLFDIIAYANKSGIKSVITTNGILIERYIDKLKEIPVGCISVSIDGTEYTHDFLRNRPGAYKAAMNGIRLLKEIGVDTAVNCVVTNQNVYELDEIHEVFGRMGVRVFFLPVVNKPHLFPSDERQSRHFEDFIRKLYSRRKISRVHYDYLTSVMAASRSSQGIRYRCMGLLSEFGIDTDGSITPCCVWENRKPELTRLGNAISDDLRGLWYSPRFHEARCSVCNDGCLNCFNPSVMDITTLTGIPFIITGKRVTAGSRQNARTNPRQVHMRFTLRCNLSCRHCDIWKTPQRKSEELTVDQWKKVIDTLYAWLGSFELFLAGGEILLYEGAVAIIEYASRKGIMVHLTSNATLINDAMARALTASGIYGVNLSVDGLRDVHCSIRNNPRGYDLVESAAKNLQKYRVGNYPYISTTTVITADNMHQLKEIIHLSREWNINNASVQALDNNFDAAYSGDWFKRNPYWPGDHDEITRVMDDLISYKKAGANIANSLGHLQAIKDYYVDPTVSVKRPCLTGIRNFIVNEKGQVLLCWNMPAVGNVLEAPPQDIWNSPDAEKMRTVIYKCQRTCRMLNCNFT